MRPSKSAESAVTESLKAMYAQGGIKALEEKAMADALRISSFSTFNWEYQIEKNIEELAAKYLSDMKSRLSI